MRTEEKTLNHKSPWTLGLPVRRIGAVVVIVSLVFGACGGVQLGRPFPEPTSTLKIGYDREADVIAKMGAPYRRTLDSRGRLLLTYLWADGEGQGQTCLVALNEDGVVALVDVAR